jgi:adenylate kinase
MQNFFITLMGPPGSGKGTISRMCRDKYGVKTLSTGDLCRTHIASGTDLGKEIEKIINSGEYIPDSWISEMVIDWFEKEFSESGLILDGYPRTKGQGDTFINFLREKKLDKIFKVVLLEVDEKILISRLTSRIVCSNKECQAVYSTAVKIPKIDGKCDECGSILVKRKDDRAEAVTERLLVYARYKNELIKFYEEAGCSIEIIHLSDQTIPEMFEEFKTCLGIE